MNSIPLVTRTCRCFNLSARGATDGQETRWSLAVAKALGIEIPQSVLLSADEVIQ